MEVASAAAAAVVDLAAAAALVDSLVAFAAYSVAKALPRQVAVVAAAPEHCFAATDFQLVAPRIVQRLLRFELIFVAVALLGLLGSVRSIEATAVAAPLVLLVAVAQNSILG